MSESNEERLLEAVKTGTLEDVKAAFEACSVDERKEYGYKALWWAAGNTGPHPPPETLGDFAFEIAKLLVERGVDPHEKDVNGYTAFIQALCYGNNAIADFFLSRDDFLPGDLIPQTKMLLGDIYKAYRDKTISRVSKLIDEKGISYARTVAADIEKMLKSKYLKPTEEDVEALQPLVRKITSLDLVADAQVSNDDFLGCDMER